MAASALGRIHQVQARFHVRRKFPLQEINDDSPSRSRFDIALANWSRRIHNHDIDSRSSRIDCHLLRHELRTLVVPDHVRQRHWTLFIRHRASVGRRSLRKGRCSHLPSRSQLGSCGARDEAHSSHARRVHHPPHTLFPRRFKQRARALDIRAIHLVRITHPQTVVRRHVKHHIAASKRLLDRSRVAQIADRSIRVQAVQVAQIARRPHQQPQLGSLFRQHARNMTTQKSRGTGNKSQHSALSYQLSVFWPKLRPITDR